MRVIGFVGMMHKEAVRNKEFSEVMGMGMGLGLKWWPNKKSEGSIYDYEKKQGI